MTLGIATYNRDTYLRAAVASALAQDYPSMEVLVVVDGATNPRIDEVLATFDDPRLRIVRHPENRGIAAAYNSFVEHGRGELIAMLGDDDLALPGRIRRQVEIFDAHPDTGVVHGDATIIDATGRTVGQWPSRELTPSEVLSHGLFSHNLIVDPTRMVHRRVYVAVGGYDARFPVANDFDFWLRAAPRFRFRHCPGGPLTAVRRHGANASDETAGQAAETADLEGILAEVVARHPLEELCPELDWAVLEPIRARRAALSRVANRLEARAVKVPQLVADLRAQARALPVPALPTPSRGRLMMTAFGWNDAGGGTAVPRLAAKELRRRGWEVTVFHAATAKTPSGLPYECREWEEDGVRLIGVHNRPHGLFDLGHPDREIDDPAITALFEAALDRHRPNVVHFHNLHNLGAALMDSAAVRGLPAYFSTHNYWLICPRAYLLDGAGRICPGPGDGSRCGTCVGSADSQAHRRRLGEIRRRAESGLTRILAVSDAVAQTLRHAGYAPEAIQVLRQAMPQDAEIWKRLGSRRTPGRRGAALSVAFLGSAYAHKGPQLLAAAAQLTAAEVRVRILGEIPAAMAKTIAELDQRGAVEICGAFAPAELPARLADVDAAVLPSLWWDCAPLAAAECRAAGLPLVVPALGGLAEVVTDGVDGLIFTPQSAESLAGALDRLALEAGLLEHLQAQITAPPRFSDYVDALEALYRNAPSAGHGLCGSPAGAEAGSSAATADGTSAGPDANPVRPRVRWKGDFTETASLSIVNAAVTPRLEVDLQRVARDGSPLDPPLVSTAAVEVRHAWPPDLSPAPAGALAVILPWEFGAVPASWAESIQRHVDELWVPSEYVAAMYHDAGIAPERIQVIPNGVDLDIFSPGRRQLALAAAPGPVRFLFVGGLILRKAPDLLLAGYLRAFAGRDDVLLSVKDVGAGGIYAAPGGTDPMRDPIRAHIASGALPRIELLDTELSEVELADLYRSSDVLVHPYRGEGFAMPVLEAMACGLAVITTAGGPTDEFCPPEAAWRIRATRRYMPAELLGSLTPLGRPWMLEPELDELIRALREAADAPVERQRRGAAGRRAAEGLSWDAVAARYRDRIQRLAERGPTRHHRALSPAHGPDGVDVGVGGLRLLATPAWRSEDDDLVTLLEHWAQATHAEGDARLTLLAPTPAAGPAEAVQARVIDAAACAGADLDRCGDITIVHGPLDEEQIMSHLRANDAYIPLHAGCGGYARLARGAGCAVRAADGIAAGLSTAVTS
ncbi:MAG TPA: glycosyltransferase [Solirubrobacteraceae bacterium]|nr:glycosyltransferase [Solirubrobacteraceae bacterium]